MRLSEIIAQGYKLRAYIFDGRVTSLILRKGRKTYATTDHGTKVFIEPMARS